MTYRPLLDSLTIGKSNIEGFGIFATKDIPKNTKLGLSHIRVDDLMVRTPLGGFYNHSDTPNCEKYKIGFYHLSFRRYFRFFRELQLEAF